MEELPGNLNLHVSLLEPSQDACYSKALNKVFVRKNAKVNFQMKIHCNKEDSLPGNLAIRAMAIFTHPEHLSLPVKVCVKHSKRESEQIDTHSERFILCEAPDSIITYETQQHMSVLCSWPQNKKEAGMVLRFMDFQSCPGGLNSRSTSLLLSLECQDLVISRKVFKLQVCSCPASSLAREECEKQQQI